ncbi:hypothetical protein BC829DRAFT_260979 [Chytridium lagenaria]|nr:hypothetical protein BC829DRAFT_260979 [Chytridium lagenaria]
MPLLQPDSWAMTYYGTNTALATDKLVMRLMESFRDYVKLKEPSQKQKIQTQKMVKLGQWKEYLYVSFEFLQNIIGLLLEGELVKNDVLRLSESRAEFLKHALQSLDAETAFLKKYQIRYLWDQILFMDPRFIGDQASCPEVIEAVNLVDSLATFFFENPQAGFAFSEHMEFFPQGFHVLMLRSLQKYLEPLNAVDAQLARVLPTSESSDVIVYLLCGCISNLSIMKSKPQSNGLDSVDLELKVLGSWLSKDLTGFLSQIKIYNTMEAFNLSLTAALQSFTEMDTSDNYALRRPEEATPTPGSIFISDIRRRLLNHLRLISAMLSTIAANWKEFDLITYIQTFIMLSSTRVVSGENTGVLRLSIIGLASWMCDEVSNSEFNKMLLNKLKECQSRLDVNANGSEMISRLLPFQVNNPYMSNIIGVVRRDSDLTGGPVLVSPYKTGYRPTEWLEMLDFLSNTGSESFAGAGLKSNVQEHVSSIPLSLFNATEVTYSSNTYEEIFHDSWIKPLESSAQFNWCTIPNGPRQDNSTLRHDAQTSMAMDVDVELSSFTKKRADGGDESDRAVKRHRLTR